MSKRCMTLFLAVALAGLRWRQTPSCPAPKSPQLRRPRPAAPPRHVARTTARGTAGGLAAEFPHRRTRHSDGRIRAAGLRSERVDRQGVVRVVQRPAVARSDRTVDVDRRRSAQDVRKVFRSRNVLRCSRTTIRRRCGCSSATANPLTKKGQLTLVKTIRGDHALLRDHSRATRAADRQPDAKTTRIPTSQRRWPSGRCICARSGPATPPINGIPARGTGRERRHRSAATPAAKSE